MTDLISLKTDLTLQLKDLEEHLDRRLDVRDAEFDKVANEILQIHALLGNDALWKEAIDTMRQLSKRVQQIEELEKANSVKIEEMQEANAGMIQENRTLITENRGYLNKIVWVGGIWLFLLTLLAGCAAANSFGMVQFFDRL